MDSPVNFNFLACLILFLAARPRLRELIAMGVVASFFGVGLGLHGNVIHETLELLSYCGAGALPAVLLMPFIRGRSEWTLLGKLLFPPCFGIVSALLLGVGVHGVTYDSFLYAFDGSLGFQPSFWAGRVVSVIPWINRFTRGVYDALPVLMVIAFVLTERRSPKMARDLFFLILLIGLCGATCFLFFPAVGAIVTCGKSFPFHPPSLSSVPVVPTVVAAAAARNCMPSLHTAWALAALWAARGFRLPWRWFLRGLLMVMLLQTLVFHYMADMIVAFPFTLALYALTQTSVPWSARTRRGTLGFAGLLFAVWLVALRWDTSVFLVSPLIPWSAALVTVTSCWFGSLLLDRASDRQSQELTRVSRLEPCGSADGAAAAGA